MKSLINLRTGAMMLMLILLSGTSAWADVDDYLLSVRNVSHTTNTIDFDLYLLDADNTQTFEFAALQMGLLLNSSIYGSGILTVSYSNTGSGLDGYQQFVFAPDVVAPLAGYAGKTLIRLMPNSIPPVPPGAGSGTVISSGGNGTLLAHFTITSSVSFTPNSRAGMEFCAGTAVSPLFPTVVFSYIGGNSTALPVTPGIDAIVEDDPLLNPTPPALFNVTGTGTYCVGGGGLTVGLSGSELSTDYTLFRNSIAVTTIPGTGSTLTFGNQTEGTYAVFATNDAGTLQMTGQAVITAVINTVSPPSSTPTLCINTPLTAITHTTSGATGIGSPVNLPGGVTASWAANTVTITGTPSAAGVYGYSIPLTGGCGSVNATGTITVTSANTIALTSAVGTNNQTVCSGTAITNITYATTGATGATFSGLPAGVTGTWSGGVVTISGTPTASGNSNYTVTLTGGCGTVTATGSINVSANNTASAASSTPTMCISTALSAITHTTSGATGIGSALGLPAGVTASWAANTITISGTPSASGTFNYTIPLTGGCGIVNATGTITVTPANTVTLTSGVGTNNQTLCRGTAITNITYSTTGATGGTVTGLPAGVAGNWSGGTVTISGTPTATGTLPYLVTLTGGCGTITASGNLNVNALPVTSVITGSATPACSAQGVTYSVTSTPGSTYTWTVPEGASVATGQGTNSITVNFGTTNGNVAVTERNTAGCYGTTVTRAISLQGCGLSADFGATPLSICVGSSVTFTNTSTGTTPTTSYSWNFGSGATPSAITGIGPHTVTYSTIGAKTISLTITEGASNTVTRPGYITVNPINTINRTSGAGTDNQTVCVNTAISNITYSTTGATGATFSGFPAGLTMGWSSNVVTISGTPSTAGTFNYTVTLTGGCGNISANGTINVSSINTAGAASSAPTVCVNIAMTPVTHLTTGATGIGTAIGLPTGVTAGWSSNTITINGTPSAVGTFNYTIPLTGGCGTVDATGTITVRANNTVTAASSTPTLCISTALSAITHTTSGATGIGSALELPAGVTASWAANTITISGTPTASGTFNYNIPLTGGCGIVNATGTITVTPANTIALTSGVGTNNQTLCQSTAITNITFSTTGATGATVTGLPAGVTGNWSGGVVTISGTPTATGTFGYTVTLTGGCGAIITSGNINVNALPVTSVITGSATPACSATGVPYSVTSTPGSTYTWTVPTGATVATGQGTSSITVNFGTSNGNVAVTERNTAGCYGTTVTRAISLQGCGLSADFGATPRSVCIGSTVLFTNLSTGASGSTTYSWNFGSGANPLTATGAGPHSVTYNTSGLKDVTLTITEGATDVETKIGFITVNPTNSITLTSGVGTNNQTVCVNTVISNITYSTTGATGATFSGLPTGVNANWSANIVTISGTPTIVGTYNYIVTLTGGCGNITASGSITVNSCLKTLTLSSVLLEGLYNGSGMMRQAQNASGAQWPAGVADHITVEFHDATNYSNIVWSATDVPLSTNGSAIISVPPAYSGTYFITIRHRNSIETTTSTAVSFAGSSIARTFALRSSVFGSNLGASGDGYYVIYGADVNQDGIVDTGDMNDVDNGSTAILIGYNLPDANGDGIVDTSDMNIVDNNSTAIIMIRLP